MKTKSKIFILSRGRSTLSGFTAEQFFVHAPKRRSDVFLVVLPQEEQAYRLLAKRYELGGVIVCPHQGLPATRQFIVDVATSRFVFMLADDIRFFYRGESGMSEWKNDDGDAMIDDLEHDLGRYVSVTMCSKSRSYYQMVHNGATRDVAARPNAEVLGYCRKKLLMTRIRFDAIASMEEFYVNICLLKIGKPNLLRYDWSWIRQIVELPGGIKTEDSMIGKLKLMELFPEYVTWRGVNFYVRWKELYNDHRHSKLRPPQNPNCEGAP